MSWLSGSCTGGFEEVKLQKQPTMLISPRTLTQRAHLKHQAVSFTPENHSSVRTGYQGAAREWCTRCSRYLLHIHDTNRPTVNHSKLGFSIEQQQAFLTANLSLSSLLLSSHKAELTTAFKAAIPSSRKHLLTQRFCENFLNVHLEIFVTPISERTQSLTMPRVQDTLEMCTQKEKP